MKSDEICIMGDDYSTFSGGILKMSEIFRITQSNIFTANNIYTPFLELSRNCLWDMFVGVEPGFFSHT